MTQMEPDEAPRAKSNRFIIVGLGRTGRELLMRLSREFETACITLNEKAHSILEELKRTDVELIIGDATSRLVLADARVDEADAVIMASVATSIIYPSVFRYLGKRILVEKEEPAQKTSPTSSTSS